MAPRCAREALGAPPPTPTGRRFAATGPYLCVLAVLLSRRPAPPTHCRRTPRPRPRSTAAPVPCPNSAHHRPRWTTSIDRPSTVVSDPAKRPARQAALRAISGGSGLVLIRG